MRRTRVGAPTTRMMLLAGSAALALLAGTEAGAIDLLTEDFTSVSVEGYLPYRASSLTSPHISVGGETNVGASTSFGFVANNAIGWSPAELDAFGYSTLGGAMGAKINLSGPSAIKAGIGTRSHDVFTVVPPPGVAQGTPGTMTFHYYVDGIADAIGLSGQTIAN